MKCLICNNEIVIKRNWETLFSKQKHLVCDKCYKKYPIKITYQVIPVQNKLVQIYSLFSKKYSFDRHAYSCEMGRLIKYILKRINKNDIFLYTKNIEDIYDDLEIISLLGKDIFIVSMFC